MKRYLLAVLAVSSFSLLWGCSESGKRSPAEAPVAPQVMLFYPPNVPSGPWTVSDSTLIYVGVAPGLGSSGTTVEFLFARPNRPDPETIGQVSQPVSLSDVPEAIRGYVHLPEGWTLYRRWWYTGPQHPAPVGTPINSGTYVQLFAIATASAGTESRSDLVRLGIFNNGDDLHPPQARFRITPVTAAANETIRFDPTPTTDKIDSNSVIQVQWDFDGDGTWDVKWEDDARADQVQKKVYTRSKTYLVRLQARNTYLPDSVGADSNAIYISPVGGRARFPDSLQAVFIPASSDTIGATRYRLDGAYFDADTLEYTSVLIGPNQYRRVRHLVHLSSYKILSHEVTNTEYLTYLNEAMANEDPEMGSIVYDDMGGRILYEGKDPADPGRTVTWVCLQLSSDVTRIYYALEDHAFKIRPGFEDHPVTGVTWRGAYVFCFYYGVRLPTEAEWEVAARGTNADYAYPWGVSLDNPGAGRWANFADSGDPYESGNRNTTPVGFYDGGVHDGFQTEDASSKPYGLSDMAGNVAEWTSDWLGRYAAGDATDPQGPQTGEYKVVRGGSYLSSRVDIRCTLRQGVPELETSFASIGFRCAWTAIQP